MSSLIDATCPSRHLVELYLFRQILGSTQLGAPLIALVVLRYSMCSTPFHRRASLQGIFERFRETEGTVVAARGGYWSSHGPEVPDLLIGKLAESAAPPVEISQMTLQRDDASSKMSRRSGYQTAARSAVNESVLAETQRANKEGKCRSKQTIHFGSQRSRHLGIDEHKKCET